MKAIISFVAGVMLWGWLWSGMAQTERKFIREGNDFFEKQNFEKAEVEYRKASDKRAESFEAAFNMADALYKQKNMRRLCHNLLPWLRKRLIRTIG